VRWQGRFNRQRRILEKRTQALIDRLVEDDDTLHTDFDTLCAFVDGGLDRSKRRAVLQHVAACASCAADIRDVRETAERLDDAARGPQPRAWMWAAAACNRHRDHRPAHIPL